MTTIIHLLFGALAVSAGPVDSAAPPAAGRVLVLDTERTLEGDVERVGEQYRVRRSVGETWVPASKVLALCATHADAHLFLRKRANLNDPDERLRLAHWCHLHHLPRQALEEVRTAVALRPDHGPSRSLLNNLERAAAQAAASDPAPQRPDERAQPPPPVEVNQETLGLFATRIQPILLNACACCHTAGRGGSFQLTRPHDATVLGRKTVQQNLTAVLAQVNLDDPGASPLLLKAVNAHGSQSQPPLKGRQAAAYRVLEEWVQRTRANHPHLRTTADAAPPSLAESRLGERPAEPAPAPEPQPAVKPSAPAAQPAPPATPADPFDPVIFNQQAHPQQKP
jgi:hypothetical protein